MPVAIYKNLVKGCWSIAECTASGNRGKVIGHADSVSIINARCIVKENGRQRVCVKQCREVHAWIIGEIVDTVPSGAAIPITYNPYRAPTFTRRDNGAAVERAAAVLFIAHDGAVAVGAVS